MSLHFHNTYTRKIEPFVPLNPDGHSVSLYTCGPTVYDYAHIGNFRAYVFEDLLQRHLEARGYVVHRVMNLTDVDDKTIRGACEKKIPLADYTQPFKEAFFADCEALHLRQANTYPEATGPENIARMIAMISTLMERGHAYQAEDGSVYFRITSFPDYGKLAHVDLEAQRPSGRVEHDEYEKEQIADFALWKKWTLQDGNVAWESPWGRGRPGWHIECSAMAMGIFGDQLDIHCGGIDNIFPHHEAEIAQCECVTGKPFVGLWMHCAHLMVEGSKMSKSAGNFYTPRELMRQGWRGREIRYALLSVHYRASLNFTIEGLEAARQSLHRIDEWQRRLNDSLSSPPLKNIEPLETLGKIKLLAFFEALDDDLNISAALAVLFDVIRESHRLLDASVMKKEEVHALLAWWKKVESVLAIATKEDEKIPEEILALLELRKTARDHKDWVMSDRLRDELTALGWQVKDTKDGAIAQRH
ncbi:MAG: cysteine--tRNA ligase [Chthoniobacterales bacterium]